MSVQSLKNNIFLKYKLVIKIALALQVSVCSKSGGLAIYWPLSATLASFWWKQQSDTAVWAGLRKWCWTSLSHPGLLWCCSVSGWMSYRRVTGAWLDCFKRPGLCATTTKPKPCLCLGARMVERTCLDSECHRVLYRQLECTVSSPIWVTPSVGTYNNST